jgi:hypothetical protein
MFELEDRGGISEAKKIATMAPLCLTPSGYQHDEPVHIGECPTPLLERLPGTGIEYGTFGAGEFSGARSSWFRS